MYIFCVTFASWSCLAKQVFHGRLPNFAFFQSRTNWLLMLIHLNLIAYAVRQSLFQCFCVFRESYSRGIIQCACLLQWRFYLLREQINGKNLSLTIFSPTYRQIDEIKHFFLQTRFFKAVLSVRGIEIFHSSQDWLLHTCIPQKWKLLNQNEKRITFLALFYRKNFLKRCLLPRFFNTNLEFEHLWTSRDDLFV